MKPTFHHRPVNGVFEDPTVYVRLFRQRKAMMFDAGEVWSLSSREINRLTDLFITHTHIDHFIGFDRVLRILLRRNTPLRVFGPEGIIEAVEGKLKGYTWNLIEEYPLVLEVTEITPSMSRTVEFSAPRSFRMEEKTSNAFEGVIIRDEDFFVRAVCLDHGIPVLAYSLEEEIHINIDKSRLQQLALPVGAWLSEFKKALKQGVLDYKVTVQGREFAVRDLRDIAIITEGQKISYVVDVSPHEENIQRIVDLVRGSHTLYIETYFLDEDRQRALERNHLTARIAGDIAREAGVKELIPLHISPKYRNFPERVLKEAQEAFRH